MYVIHSIYWFRSWWAWIKTVKCVKKIICTSKDWWSKWFAERKTLVTVIKKKHFHYIKFTIHKYTYTYVDFYYLKTARSLAALVMSLVKVIYKISNKTAGFVRLLFLRLSQNATCMFCTLHICYQNTSGRAMLFRNRDIDVYFFKDPSIRFE